MDMMLKSKYKNFWFYIIKTLGYALEKFNIQKIKVKKKLCGVKMNSKKFETSPATVELK